VAKITKRVVDSAKPGASDYFIWDDEIAGFGLRVLPSGKKSYLIQYRTGGRTRRMSLGRHGTVTPDAARKRAKTLLGLVAKGEDPAEERSSHRRSPTVSTVCDRFLNEHVPQRCKPRTAKEYQRSVDLFIKPAIGTHKIVDVARADIAKLHTSMSHIPYQANRTLGVLSVVFNLAEIWGLRQDGSNPCRHVKKFKEEKRERFLSKEELANLGCVLDEIETETPEAKPALDAVRLLVVTGARLSEILTLKWSYIKGKMAVLPDSKTGPKTLYLFPPAIKVLKQIPVVDGNPYVIVGRVPGHHLTDLEKPWRRIRKRAGLDDVRIHDLRHTFASLAVGQGMSLPMIGKLLGHQQVQTTARYAHLADDHVTAYAEQFTTEFKCINAPSGYEGS
jgi:integrase